MFKLTSLTHLWGRTESSTFWSKGKGHSRLGLHAGGGIYSTGAYSPSRFDHQIGIRLGLLQCCFDNSSELLNVLHCQLSCRRNTVLLCIDRRADREPSKSSRLCSCHFKDGSKDNLPDIFSGNVKKRFSFTSPQRFAFCRHFGLCC